MEEVMQLNVLAALEEAEILAEQPRRIFRAREDPFDLSDHQFIKMFRLNKDLCRELINMVEPFLNPLTRVGALNSTVKVLTALRFFAGGSYQMDTGCNIHMALSQASVSRCIAEISDILNRPEIFNRWVAFPHNLEELGAVRTQFYNKFGFPGVAGCIDCTHVAIVAPPSNDEYHPEHIYVNRKRYHSINVQLICDSALKILNVNARFPGSTHDAFIWRNSEVQAAMRRLHEAGRKDFYLIGDSGYPLRTWLMTPFENAEEGTPEFEYNRCLTRTRCTIERCNGVLKMRFRCLLKHRVLHYHPERAAKIINACVVLHNMCIENNIPHPEEDVNEDHDLGIIDNNILDHVQAEPLGRVHPELAAGRQFRQRIVNRYFIQ